MHLKQTTSNIQFRHRPQSETSFKLFDAHIKEYSTTQGGNHCHGWKNTYTLKNLNVLYIFFFCKNTLFWSEQHPVAEMMLLGPG